jgi:hypothetical protein
MSTVFARCLAALYVFVLGLAIGFCFGAHWATSLYSQLYQPQAQEATP